MGPGQKLGHTGIAKHRIDTADARPIKQPPHRLPVHLQSQVEAMLQAGIIEPSDSPWASPIFLIKES